MKLLLGLPIIGLVECDIVDINAANFTERQFANYIISKKDVVCKRSKIKYICSNKDKLHIEKIINDQIGLGRKIHTEHNQIIIDNYVVCVCKDSIEVYNNEQKSLLRKIVKKTYYCTMGSREEKRYSSLHAQFYKEILYPIFALYGLIGGYYLIHGSLLEKNDAGIIITGLDGVGKTSICKEMVKNKNYKILSDNFVLFNGNTAVPLNLAMRINRVDDARGFEVIYKNKDIMEIIATERREQEYGIDKMFNLVIGNELKVEKKYVDLGNIALFLNCAPEIGKGNKLVAVCSFLCMMCREVEDTNIKMELYNVSIPYGDIAMGAEVIDNEC